MGYRLTVPASFAMSSEIPSVTLSPGTVVSNPTGIAGIAWGNPSNAKTNNDTPATAGSPLSGHTEWLFCTNFGFSLSSMSIVRGIKVNIKRRRDAGTVKDNSIKLIQAGNVSGSDKADTTTLWPISYTTRSYGNASDLWGLSFLYSDINSANFGVAISVQSPGDGIPEVDYVTITVYYD